MGEDNYQGLQKSTKPKYIPLRVLMEGATPTTFAEDVRRELDWDEERRGPVDPELSRRLQDWSFLNQLVVGAEGPEDRQSF